MKMENSEIFDEYAGNYQDLCDRGVSLSGETPEYFAQERISFTAAWLAERGLIRCRQVADFGCGIGSSTPHLLEAFPSADVIGMDVSDAVLQEARKRHGTHATFQQAKRYVPKSDRQMVYSSGVFHHITPVERDIWAAYMFDLLMPGGYLALWENNPWNIGTRIIMRRIPFDRDAILVYPREAKKMLARTGFEVCDTRFRFYLPRALGSLRFLEKYGERIPLGAQYCVFAMKPH